MSCVICFVSSGDLRSRAASHLTIFPGCNSLAIHEAKAGKSIWRARPGRRRDDGWQRRGQKHEVPTVMDHRHLALGSIMRSVFAHPTAMM
jgi:hypothetical protein